ncbi:hypothetical protein GCK72_020945 [Caenorhabditis remanei]|uniref:Peptidase A1 domain-containing protein n=1 Tax=Caenorhabditis remanei TaxID=31234 RepID=A0A6A5GHY0_CAERE|nr:hypothetical protein GCK72_020945 [Caenorhabditis remanei]KAF1754384.1 hypothetical protein GCK72_020945 [Caenorhabditis remanei]
MQRADNATKESSGSITYGGFDGEACDKNIQYLPLAQPGVWGFFVEGWSMGSFKGTQNETAISASSSGWTGVPTATFSHILKATKAKFDWELNAYTVSCSTIERQPDLNLNIGGNTYTIKSLDYVLDLGLNNGQCALAFFSSAKMNADWILGDAFIRGYCHVYDFGNSRVGLSKFVKRD